MIEDEGERGAEVNGEEKDEGKRGAKAQR